MRFGPYEFDSAGRELTKNGLRLKISGQPLEVLGLLLERPGTAVTRKELFDRLWAADTFVDFDHSLNTAIKRLRRALDDDPEHPTYVETIPKHGYRFIGTVEEQHSRIDPLPLAPKFLQDGTYIGTVPGAWLVASGSEVKEDRKFPASPLPKQFDQNRSSGAGVLAQPIEPVSALSRSWMRAAVGGVAVLLAVGVAFVWHRYRPVQAALTQKDSVLLADFQNTTGEPVFDGALKNGLAIELSQSPYLDIVSKDRDQEILRLMGRSPDAPLVPSLAREVCQRAGGKAVIAGSIVRLGSSYIVALQAENCGDGRTLVYEQQEVASKEDVLRVLGQISATLRRKLGESPASIRAFDVPLQQVTTVSLEALKAYSLGVDHRAEGNESRAIPLFEHAVELDPGFAMAYAQLGAAYNNLGESPKAGEYLRKAYALRDHLSERERLFLTVRYYTVVSGDTDRAVQTAEMWTEIYPRDWIPFNTLSARYQVMGEYEEAAEAAEHALKLQSDNYLPYANLARSYLALNRFDDARRIAKAAEARQRDGLDTHQVLFDLAFLRQDHAAMQRELEWGAASSRSNDMLATEGFAQASAGHLRSALEILERSWEADSLSGKKDDEAYSMGGAAVFEADVGELRGARSRAEEALKLGQGIDGEETAAEALALSGGVAHARVLITELQQRFPHHVPLNSASLPTVLAAIEVQTGHPARAIKLLQATAPYDLCEFASLAPVYIRGQAFLRLGQGPAAGAEFQKVIDHPGIDVTSPRHALAHLGLARALAMSKDRLAARKTYEQFFALWVDADRELPELHKAKLEYARINSSR